MIRRVALVVALVGLFVAGSLAPVRVHAQSDALVSVLTEMQQLSQSDFNTLVSWAKNGTPAPFSNFFQPDKTMSDILALGDKDRQAVLWWLQGNGRSALYARGA